MKLAHPQERIRERGSGHRSVRSTVEFVEKVEPSSASENSDIRVEALEILPIFGALGSASTFNATTCSISCPSRTGAPEKHDTADSRRVLHNYRAPDLARDRLVVAEKRLLVGKAERRRRKHDGVGPDSLTVSARSTAADVLPASTLAITIARPAVWPTTTSSAVSRSASVSRKTSLPKPKP